MDLFVMIMVLPLIIQMMTNGNIIVLAPVTEIFQIMKCFVLRKIKADICGWAHQMESVYFNAQKMFLMRRVAKRHGLLCRRETLPVIYLKARK